jgi:hypothetical protein
MLLDIRLYLLPDLLLDILFDGAHHVFHLKSSKRLPFQRIRHLYSRTTYCCLTCSRNEPFRCSFKSLTYCSNFNSRAWIRPLNTRISSYVSSCSRLTFLIIFFWHRCPHSPTTAPQSKPSSHPRSPCSTPSYCSACIRETMTRSKETRLSYRSSSEELSFSMDLYVGGWVLEAMFCSQRDLGSNQGQKSVSSSIHYERTNYLPLPSRTR